jgi:hypothetical protein
VWSVELYWVIGILVNLNGVFNLRRLRADLDLCRIRMLLFWTPLAMTLLKFHLVHMSCHIFVEGWLRLHCRWGRCTREIIKREHRS